MKDSAFIGVCPRCYSLVATETGKCVRCGRRLKWRYKTHTEFFGAIVAVVLIFAFALLLSLL